MTSETGAAACTLLEAVQLTTDRDQRIITDHYKMSETEAYM